MSLIKVKLLKADAQKNYQIVGKNVIQKLMKHYVSNYLLHNGQLKLIIEELLILLD